MDPSFIKEGFGLIDWSSGQLRGQHVQESKKTLGQLRGIFRDVDQWARMSTDQIVYRVQWIQPGANDVEGGLNFGNTTIEPGRVGDEYFMTHGHFHTKADRGEFYATVKGTGYLLFMDRERKSWAEPMSPGSIHYVSAGLAHRVANTGLESLRFVACWPSDAGHDYESIQRSGFSIRVVCENGSPKVIRCP